MNITNVIRFNYPIITDAYIPARQSKPKQNRCQGNICGRVIGGKCVGYSTPTDR